MLSSGSNFGMRIEISREELLLDTGGGLKKAAWFFEETQEPFILHNVDVLSTIDLNRMLEFHQKNRALVTLAVQNRKTSRYLLFDEHNQLRGRRAGNPPSDQVNSAADIQAFAFSGIHVISPRLLGMLSEDGAFSIIDSYLRLAGRGETIVAFGADEYYWRDLGKPENVTQATQDVERQIVQL